VGILLGAGPVCRPTRDVGQPPRRGPYAHRARLRDCASVSLCVWDCKGYGLGAEALFTALTQRLPSVLPALPHVSAIDFDHAAGVRTCRTCSCDAAPSPTSSSRDTQAHNERLCRTCTHAPTKLGSASRGHGRPACTQEAHPQPISTRARTLRHCDCELAADVAVSVTAVGVARDGCTNPARARRAIRGRSGRGHGHVCRARPRQGAESRRGRTAACEVHPTSVTKRSVPRIQAGADSATTAHVAKSDA